MKKLICLMAILGLFMGLASCSTDTTATIGKGETQAAYTMNAVLTLSAYQTVEAKLTEVSAKITPETTIISSLTPLATQGTNAPQPQVTPAAGGTSQTFYPAANAPCNWAEFVKDVTMPDGSGVNPNQKFTKTWRLKNIGTCSWDKNYKLISAGGADMSAPKETPLSMTIAPGAEVEISVEMTAPNQPGTYISYWMLQSGDGKTFGIGTKANGIFYANVQVGGSKNPAVNTALFMAANTCNAGWFSSTSGVIACPTSLDSTTGGVIKVDSVVMEGGTKKALPAIIMVPPNGTDGKITGQFPVYQVQTGDHFRTTIGCQDGFSQCDVIFQVSYIAADNSAHSLGSWGHTLDAYYQDVDIDLSNLAGTTIQMILSVYNNGSSTDDRAVWLNPIVSP